MNLLFLVSKFANIWFTLELSRRLEGTKITVNALYPGVVDTGIWRNVPFPMLIATNLYRCFYKTPKEEAETTVYLATSNDINEVTGK